MVYMKTQFLAPFFVGILLCFGSFCQAQNKTSGDSAVIMLKQFYTAYITADDEKQLSSLQKKYCTKKILKRIADDEELDSDPFINAQDTDADWLRTMVINKDAQKPNVYVVSYVNNYTQKRIINKLLVVKEGKAYKIDDILTY